MFRKLAGKGTGEARIMQAIPHLPKTCFDLMQPKGRTAAGSHPYKEHNCKCLLSLFHNNVHSTNTELKGLHQQAEAYWKRSSTRLPLKCFAVKIHILAFSMVQGQIQKKGRKAEQKKCPNDVIKAT